MVPQQVHDRVVWSVGQRTVPRQVLCRSCAQRSARRTIKLIAAAAAVNEDISPHSLRRSFATTAIATGVPIRDLQVTLRHKSIKTTTIYDRGGKSHDRNSTHRVSSFIAGIADM